MGIRPVGVAFDGANIWVSNFGDNTVTKISPANQQIPSISSAGIVPLCSTASTIQPGEWISIYGNNLSSGTAVWNGNFPRKARRRLRVINDEDLLATRELLQVLVEALEISPRDSGISSEKLRTLVEPSADDPPYPHPSRRLSKAADI